jgi:hypothetical protein
MNNPTKASGSVRTQRVPRPVDTEGNPDDVVPVQVKIPRWLKNGLHEVARIHGRDLTEQVKEMIREAMAAAGVKRRK